MSFVIHPNAKMTPSLLMELLNQKHVKSLVALTLNDEGFYEVYYTDDVEFSDLCVMSTLLQSAALDALGGLDEDDEE